MPISRESARKGAENMRGMRMYPDVTNEAGKASMRAIVDRLQEHCQDESHAMRATAKLRDSEDFFPTPAAVIEACEQTRVSTKPKAHPQCGYCHGSGWEVVTRGDAEGVRRCRCGGLPPVPDAAKSFDAPATFAEVIRLAERDGVR